MPPAPAASSPRLADPAPPPLLPGAPSPWQRLCTALMPDYNRRAAACWWLMVLAGFTLLGACLLKVAAQPPLVWLHVAVGMGPSWPTW